ncbi:MAG TPA: polysaccharide biosynthesis/export family protein [Terriglobales bacterium]|nr:polysaccharide biosynthesis/export family protein [Terriglobales bacterium]
MLPTGRGAARMPLLLILPLLAAAQAPSAAAPPPPAAQRLQPGDLIAISVFQAPELATEARLDASGAITMPAAGRVELAGRSAAAAERALAARLQADYLKAPEVHVTVRAFAPQPVSVLGAVKAPGVYSARSYPTLVAMLAAAGGLVAPEGERILVTRAGGAAPLALNSEELARSPHAPVIALHAGDVVRVVPAASIYIGGDVAKPGAYLLPASGLTLVEALSLAGGVRRDGRADHTRIVHRAPDGRVRVTWLNANPILDGRAPDVALRPLDLVYVPHSVGRATLFRGLETVVATGSAIISGVIIFH